MPYHIGEKGSNGCSGYPVVKDSDGKVMGCHETETDAQSQLAALHINEPDAIKADSSVAPTNPSMSPLASYPGVGIKYPEVNPRKARKPRKGRRNRGMSPNAQFNSGAGTVVSGGSGGSISSKSHNIWTGSPFGGING